MTESVPYRVLARKYRPACFADLIGQEAMVRTLRNAIAAGRLAHAFILTGVRGIGKTTTARIIARALNCVGADGQGGPTIEPCGQCVHCAAIAEDRHVDVQEMDAASRTGVNDIRELIEGVRYRPTSARFKVYIIDEVHMLSNAAFNALLKTLEEPPPHVKFIFATTEIRKVPITVLSRCQRFDLRRVDAEPLAAHFTAIAAKENVSVEADALALLARAADGSVRDGLSLLDQAIAHGDGKVTAVQVRDMLGLADRTLTFDLFDALMRGQAQDALEIAAKQYAGGADPAVMLEDLLALTHWLTRLRVEPKSADDPMTPEAERVRGRDMAGRLNLPILSRTWQMLLKGLAETRTAPQPFQSLEMVLVRLCFVSDQPGPAEALEALSRDGASGASARPSGGSVPPASGGARAVASGGAMGAAQPVAQSQPTAQAKHEIATFAAMVALFEEKREAILASHLMHNVHLISFEQGRIEINLASGAPGDLATKAARLLGEWTGRTWLVSVSNQPGAPSLAQQRAAQDAEAKASAATHPLVQAVLAAFPGAVIAKVTETAAADEAAENDFILPAGTVETDGVSMDEDL